MTRKQALLMLVNHVEHDFYELDQFEFMKLARKYAISPEDILECLSDKTIQEIENASKQNEQK